MLDVLRFIFSSPWVFLGMLPILAIALLAWVALIKGIVGVVAIIVARGKSSVTVE